jgi:hypothetical protein
MEGDNFKGFFDWLAKPMEQEDVNSWYLANNIIPEYTELFRDFCISFLNLLNDTYLGNSGGENTETKVSMTEKQKKDHFRWCWERTIKNFKKENIDFIFDEKDYDFFESFFYEIFYNQEDEKLKKSMDEFFIQLFDDNHQKTKADLEIFTDIYKTLERSLVIG